MSVQYDQILVNRAYEEIDCIGSTLKTQDDIHQAVRYFELKAQDEPHLFVDRAEKLISGGYGDNSFNLYKHDLVEVEQANDRKERRELVKGLALKVACLANTYEDRVPPNATMYVMTKVLTDEGVDGALREIGELILSDLKKH